MANLNLDTVLSFLARASWALFIVYVIIVLIRLIIRKGLVRAAVELVSFRILLPLLVPIAVSLLSLAILFVPPQETAVIVSVVSPGGVRPEALRSGLHIIVPLLEYEAIYPISWQTYTMSSNPRESSAMGSMGNDSISARTSDGQEVLLDTSVIFRIDPEQAVTVYIDWQQRYTADFIRPVVRGSVLQQVSQFTVTEVNSSARTDLEALLDRLLREELAAKGFILDQFLLRSIAFTREYALAVEQKQVAFEGQLRTEYEAQQTINLANGRATAIEVEADARANAIVLEAQARANSLKLIAEALAGDEQLLTYSYIERLAPNIQVMLLPNDAPFLFPLPDLTAGNPLTDTAAAVSSGLLPTPTPAAPTPTPAATLPLATPAALSPRPTESAADGIPQPAATPAAPADAGDRQ